MILDIIGIRKAIVIYSSTICVGAGILTIAGFSNNLPLMLIGRVLVNAGAEVLFIPNLYRF